MNIPARSRGILKMRAGHSYVARELMRPAQKFIYTEGVSGIVLFVAALVALVWANSPWRETYFALWETVIAFQLGGAELSESLLHWINDGLMGIFFLLVGLEIKREIVHGELSSWRHALLPVLAGLGGMAVPALIYAAINWGSAGQAGWGIPMATDIAFALGALALLGRRVPLALRLFLLTFAIVDDIGAILVIALFYTQQVYWDALQVAAVLLIILFLMNRTGVRRIRYYVLAGLLLWGAVFESGIHPTIAGVLLALFIPAHPYFRHTTYLESIEKLLDKYRAALQRKDAEGQETVLGEIELLSKYTETPLERMERNVHPWSSYVVLPLFALANAGIPLGGSMLAGALSSPITWGVFWGLVVGKPLGIVGMAWLSVKLKLTQLPADVRWSHMWGVGLLAAIGFTVALFIAGLSFSEATLVDEAKIGIVVASLVGGMLGAALLFLAGRRGP